MMSTGGKLMQALVIASFFTLPAMEQAAADQSCDTKNTHPQQNYGPEVHWFITNNTRGRNTDLNVKIYENSSLGEEAAISVGETASKLFKHGAGARSYNYRAEISADGNRVADCGFTVSYKGDGAVIYDPVNSICDGNLARVCERCTYSCEKHFNGSKIRWNVRLSIDN